MAFNRWSKAYGSYFVLRVLLACSLLLQLFSSAGQVGKAANVAQEPQETSVRLCGESFTPDQDAQISQANAGTAYGTQNRLRVAKGGDDGEWRTLLLFNLGSLPENSSISRAYLKMTIAEGASRVESFSRMRIMEAWNEPMVTWNTQPQQGALRGTTTATFDEGVLHIDVTSMVQSWSTNRLAPFSLTLVPGVETMDVGFFSRESRSGAPQLIIHCTVPRPSLQLDRAAREVEQQNQLTRLRSNSVITPEIELREGMVTSLLFDLQLPEVSGTTPISRTHWFLRDYRDLFQLSDPDTQVQLTRRASDGSISFFRQLHQGIPVYASNVSILENEGRILHVVGNYLPFIERDSVAQLSATQAEMLALAHGTPDARIIGETQLTFYHPALLGFADRTTYLTWRVSFEGAEEATRTLLIDAETGQVRFEEPHEIEAYHLYVGTANHKSSSIPCQAMASAVATQWFDETGPIASGWGASDMLAWLHIGAIYKLWKTEFNYDSYDDLGSKIHMFLHVGNNWENASAYYGCFKFGDGYDVRDVISHEFTHSVDDYQGKLPYINQSGALDESFADIFGYFADPDDWTLGEDLPGGTMRDLSNPPAFGQPDKMSDYKVMSGDNGGVHINSGIPNKAAFLIIAGGSHNGRQISGMGNIKARHLFYSVLVNSVSQYTDFKTAALLAVSRAQYWQSTGKHGFTQQNVCSVRNAYAAVELIKGDADCDGKVDSDDSDVDGDGTTNRIDNCPLLANPGQWDLDQDGKGNVCDDDKDNDTILNANDNCPFTANKNQADWNSDGRGDVCDDSDDDLIYDAYDNCREIANPTQRNFDNDEFGDACDNDIDGDGIGNLPLPNVVVDNCPLTPNPKQEDSDLDKIGNACDLCPTTPSQDNNDDDGDGVGNPCDPDDENDGILDTTDNCRTVPNPDQTDINKNGVGVACDGAEQLLFKKVTDKVFIPKEIPFRIPVPICPDCTFEWLPDNYIVTIDLTLAGGSTARVLDSNGAVLVQSVATATDANHTLKFKPSAESYFPETGLNAANTISEATNSRLNYYIEITPAADPNGDRTYDLDYEMTQEVVEEVDETPQNQIYLPLVTR